MLYLGALYMHRALNMYIYIHEYLNRVLYASSSLSLSLSLYMNMYTEFYALSLSLYIYIHEYVHRVLCTPSQYCIYGYHRLYTTTFIRCCCLTGRKKLPLSFLRMSFIEEVVRAAHFMYTLALYMCVYVCMNVCMYIHTYVYLLRPNYSTHSVLAM
jgi:hypothetical protein